MTSRLLQPVPRLPLYKSPHASRPPSKPLSCSGQAPQSVLGAVLGARGRNQHAVAPAKQQLQVILCPTIDMHVLRVWLCATNAAATD